MFRKIIVGLSLTLFGCAITVGQTFTPIGRRATGAVFISDNGSTVAGTDLQAQQAFAWSTAAKTVWPIPSGPNNIYCISGDGSMVGGDCSGNSAVFIAYRDGHLSPYPALVPEAFSYDGSINYGEDGEGDGYHADSWSLVTGRVSLFHSTPGDNDIAKQCSDDGAFVYYYADTGHAWLWNKKTAKAMKVGDFRPNFCSADGLTVAGVQEPDRTKVNVWNQTGGLTRFGLPGQAFQEQPSNIGDVALTLTADGSTVWGTYFDSSQSSHAYIWTAPAGVKDLGAHTQFFNEKGQRGSAIRFPGSWQDSQGKTHYGYYDINKSTWLDIQALLEATGQNLTGWADLRVEAIAANDTDMAGFAGTSPTSNNAFFVHMPAITSPVLNLSVLQPSATGGTSVTGSVNTTIPVPADTTINLLSDSASVTVPVSVTVKSGSNSAPFTLVSQPVDTDTVAHISAALGSQQRSILFTVQAPTLNLLVLNPPFGMGGLTFQESLSLNGPAGPSGATVHLSSNGSQFASVPATVSVPAGQSQATFSIVTGPVSSVGSVLITATFSGLSRSARLSLAPAMLSGIQFSENPLLSGDSATGFLTLYGLSGSARTVLLSSDNPAIVVPSSVQIPAGARYSSAFPITSTLVNRTQTAKITATFGADTFSAPLTMTPAAFQVTVNSPTLSGHNTTATITLANPAPTNGFTIGLNAGDAASIRVPASATVPGGATSVIVPITVFGSNNGGRQHFFATAGPLTRVCYVYINPAVLTSIQVGQASLKGGQATTARTLLNGMNGTLARTISLKSDNPNVQVPASVTLAPNATLSHSFTITSSIVSTIQIATITATDGSVSCTVTVTVNP